MKVRLENNDSSIHAMQMKDGEIGIITDWNGRDRIGCIVQRYGDILIEIGKKHNRCLEVPKKENQGDMTDCYIQLLCPGDKIVICPNEEEEK